MGQQQLLLIVLGVIIVAVALLLGIVLFQQNAIEQKRDLLINEGLLIAENASTYYYKAKELGGGGRSFDGWEIPNQMVNSPNGSFSSTINTDNVEIIGTGNEVVSGVDSVKVKFVVTAQDIKTTVLK
jgi:hypothetical protein